MLLLFILIVYGLIVLYSAGGAVVVNRQIIRIILGVAVMLIITQIRPERFESLTPLIYMGSVLLLLAVFLFGIEVKGAQRWLDIGISIQPSELSKLTVPMMIAWIFRHASLPPDWKSLSMSLLIIMLAVVFIYIQPDLGTAILVVASGIFVIFLAGISWKLIATGGLLAIVSAPVLWQYMHSYQQQRVLMFLNPESDPLNSGWNIIQSKIAIGSGGLFGKGWQQGTQTHLDFLPEHSTDFILSVLSEEFGFFGVMFLFILYTLIILRCFYIAQNAKNTYNRLICGALSMTFFVYIVINAGMISGVLPVVGIPLPMVSYGGTSILTLLASFGIIMSVHTHKKLIQQ